MLVMDETVNQYKQRLRDDISRSRTIISLLAPHNDAGEFTISIVFLRGYIKELLAELITIERWRLKEGLGRDEPYLPPSLRKTRKDRNAR